MSRTVCFCFEVEEDTIINIIKNHNAKTVEEIQKHCKAGLGCGGCRPDIEEIIEKELGKTK